MTLINLTDPIQNTNHSVTDKPFRMDVKKQPWAVLVCRFSDDADPASVLVKDLPGLNPVDPNDNRTVLDLFRMFFTQQGNNTFNAVRYFNEMSHGSIDLNDSQVFVVNLKLTKADQDALDKWVEADPVKNGPLYQLKITLVAQVAAKNQGVNLQDFYGIVITSHYYLSMAQGGGVPGGPIVSGPVGWAGMDYRWVKDHGIQSWGQEMGHGFGLDHSRADDPNFNPFHCQPGLDYRDPWDIMSTQCAYSAYDQDYGRRGPGLNAWNMRSRGWLDETRVWHCPNAFFEQTLELRPLHDKDLDGFLAAELPPFGDAGGFARYLVEYRIKEGWDDAIPRSCVLVHRFEGSIGQFLGTNSYLMIGNKGVPDLVTGDAFVCETHPGIKQKLEVLNIDDISKVATIRLSNLPVSPVFAQFSANKNANGCLEIFALGQDKSVYCIEQTAPNGDWSSWSFLSGHDVQQITSGSNADGRLQLFALGGDGTAYQTWQDLPNGTFGPWSSLGGHEIQQLVVGSNADGRLQLFALGGNGVTYQTWQDVPNGSFGPWSGLGGHEIQQLVVGRNADGRLQLFALGGNGATYQTWQDVPNGSFGSWSGLGGHDVRQLAVGSNADGRLQLFALGGNGVTYQTWQDVPNGTFGPWSGLGGHEIRQLAVGSNADGRLQLFALGGDGAGYQTWQDVPNGSFGPWSSLKEHDLS